VFKIENLKTEIVEELDEDLDLRYSISNTKSKAKIRTDEAINRQSRQGLVEQPSTHSNI